MSTLSHFCHLRLLQLNCVFSRGKKRRFFSSSKINMKGNYNIIENNQKPPNILILCQDTTKRGKISSLLKSIVAVDRYVIYDMNWNQVTESGWTNQTALLIISGQLPLDSSQSLIPGKILQDFVLGGGKLFGWCCDNNKYFPFTSGSICENQEEELKRRRVLIYNNVQTVPLSISSPLYTHENLNELPHPFASSLIAQTSDSNEAAVVKIESEKSSGIVVLSRVNFEEDANDESSVSLLRTLLTQYLNVDCARVENEMPEYTHGHLLGDSKEVQNFLSSVPKTAQQSNLTIEWLSLNEKESSKSPSAEFFPVKCFGGTPSNFSVSDYYNNLTTKHLGRLLIYTDILTTSMNVFNGQSLKHGLAVVAARQTAGRGRGKNVFLSPEGSASVTVQLDIKLNSEIGHRLPLVQQIGALSMILAVPRHKEIKMRVKWPNDIYLGSQKIGGVLTETRIVGSSACVIMGIGVNLSNKYPTACINSVLPDEEKINSATLAANCLSEMEKMLDEIENGDLDYFLDAYTDNWVHEMQETVDVEVKEKEYAQCQIYGLDDFGFLKVKNMETGELISVASDGNSFDITNKLIAIKT